MRTILTSTIVGISFLLASAATTIAAPSEEDLMATVSKLVLDKDQEVHAVGLEQVREGLKGTDATRRFVALLPQLAVDGQAALITALGDRGDAAALPGILKFIASDTPPVRAAAIRAVGAMGGKEQAAVLVPLLGNPDTEQDAVAAILCLKGAGVHQSLLEAAKARPALRAKVFPLMVALYSREAVPELLAAAEDSDAGVRNAALAALGQLAGPEQVAELACLIVKAPDAAARQQVERALATLSGRNPNPDACAQPLLAFMKTQATQDRAVLLTALGRVGGKAALKIALGALSDADPAIREAGLRALCNWPDGTVSAKLVEVATQGETEAQRAMALESLIRVAPLPNNRSRPDTNRSDQERLKMLQKAMQLSTTRQQKARILQRASAIYTFDTFKFVLPYLDQPEFAQVAAETIVAIAHHKEVRHAHKAEFEAALERVIRISNSPKVINEATRYKEDRT